jgi:cytidyltransferase-like protein
MAGNRLISERAWGSFYQVGPLKIGCVHGRFQPFHNGHLDYVLQAFDHADFVSVGLTQIFKPRGTDETEGRNSAAANPLTFYQRSQLVTAALNQAGIGEERFDIIPFPIETPTKLREFIGAETICFTTVLTRWNSEKIRVLEREGFEVVRLKIAEIDGIRVSIGTHIRSLIRSGDESWKRFVPQSTFDLISSRYIDEFITRA